MVTIILLVGAACFAIPGGICFYLLTTDGENAPKDAVGLATVITVVSAMMTVANVIGAFVANAPGGPN